MSYHDIEWRRVSVVYYYPPLNIRSFFSSNQLAVVFSHSIIWIRMNFILAFLRTEPAKELRRWQI
jgi:hypothetical protein